jgi:hypothetical protein
MPLANNGCKGASSADGCVVQSRCSSSGSNISMAGLAPATTAGSTNSLWELAVRRGSAAALAPGYALKHKPWAENIEGVHKRSCSADQLAADSDKPDRSHDSGPSCLKSGIGRPRLDSAGTDGVVAQGGQLIGGGQCQEQDQLAVVSSGEVGTSVEFVVHQADSCPAAVAMEGPVSAAANEASAAADPAAAGPWQCSNNPSAANDQAAVQAAVAQAALLDAATADSAAYSSGAGVPLELLEEALHWHHYANAVYGWPMFLWSHRYRCVMRRGGLCAAGDWET